MSPDASVGGVGGDGGDDQEAIDAGFEAGVLAVVRNRKLSAGRGREGEGDLEGARARRLRDGRRGGRQGRVRRLAPRRDALRPDGPAGPAGAASRRRNSPTSSAASALRALHSGLPALAESEFTEEQRRARVRAPPPAGA